MLRLTYPGSYCSEQDQEVLGAMTQKERRSLHVGEFQRIRGRAPVQRSRNACSLSDAATLQSLVKRRLPSQAALSEAPQQIKGAAQADCFTLRAPTSSHVQKRTTLQKALVHEPGVRPSH